MPRPPRRTSSKRERSAALETLTPRELEVLECLVSGARTRAIAHDLGIAEPTVKRHLTNLYRKLGATNRVEAVTSFLGEQPRRARTRRPRD
jgi:NarL family two-component system response regulator YdfI